jgi:3-hydroxyisobutyrate dehydrogenase
MRVGFAGLGRMGAPMARNLARAGFAMTLWNRSADKAQALADEFGGAVAETPRALAAACDTVVTMLADDAASETAHLGPEGFFAAQGGARRFVVMGTHSPAHIRRLAEAAPEGAAVIDAPVSGATQAADTAQLLVMAGCDDADLESLRPILDALGRRTIALGATGRGAAMKLAVNAALHGLNQAFAEAMALAEAAGIDPAHAFDVFEASAVAAPMLCYRRPLYLDEAAHPVSFTVALARKDMEVAVALAEDLGAAAPQARETLRLLRAAEAGGYADRDMAAMLDCMRKART